VFTARYGLIPYVKQICLLFKKVSLAILDSRSIVHNEFVSEGGRRRRGEKGGGEEEA
jgi:hypothetical protein